MDAMPGWSLIAGALSRASATGAFTDPIMIPGIWSLSVPGALIGLVVILVLMLATGKLYTSSQHKEIVAGLEKQIAYHQGAAAKWEGVANVLNELNEALAASALVSKDFIERADLRKKEG